MPEKTIPHIGFNKLPSVLTEIEAGIAEHLHIGAQLFVSHKGNAVADAAAGWARADVAMRPDSVNHWLSSGKPITSVAIALLRERGAIDIDTPVAHYIPEFGLNGKQDITTRHILTHTAGMLEAESADRLGSREEVIGAICESPIADDWTPGERAAYQPTAGWHILGELIFRLTGHPIEDFADREILGPLGMADASLIWTADDRDALGDRWSPMHGASRDGKLEPQAAFSVEKQGTFARPGSSFRAPASSFGRLYEMLLSGGELNGKRILEAESVRDMVERHRHGLVDETFGMKLDWGLGIIPNNGRYGAAVPYGFGPHASESAFGHGGSMSSTGFADPGNGLVVTLVFNGMPGHPKHDRRLKRTLAALYEDLRLA